MTSPYNDSASTNALADPNALPSSGTQAIGYGDNIADGGRTIIFLTSSDLISLAGLGTAATKDVGVSAGQVPLLNSSALIQAVVIPPITNAMLAGSIVFSKLVGTDIVLTESQVTNLVSDLAGKASDTSVVHKTGNESISGVKTFTSTIGGSISGNSSTVTTNANLTGPVTSSGNATAITAAAVTNGMLAGAIAFSKLVGSDIILTESQVTNLIADLASKASDASVVHNTGNETISGIKTFLSTIVGSISGNAGTVSTNANLTGPVTSSGNATAITSAAITNGMLAGSIAFSKLIGTDITLTQSQITNLVADLATKISANQNITVSGDASGSGNIAITLTLASSGASPGTYNNVTVDAKGRVTTGSNISYLIANQNITFSGDATGSGATAVALTLANSGVSAGSYGSTTASSVITVDAKGRVTAASSATITPAFASITGKPTTVAGYGITDALTTATGFGGDVSGIYSAITLASVGTAGTYTTVTTDAKGRVTSGTAASQSAATRTIQTVAAAANGWQLSATRASMAMYSVKISGNLNIEGDVVIEINPANTAVATDWVKAGQVNLGQSGGLAAPTQIGGGQVIAFVPVGYYVRLRSINVAGAATYAYVCGQEVLL